MDFQLGSTMALLKGPTLGEVMALVVDCWSDPSMAQMMGCMMVRLMVPIFLLVVLLDLILVLRMDDYLGSTTVIQLDSMMGIWLDRWKA